MKKIPAKLRRLWGAHGRSMLACAVIVMAAVAATWLGYEFYRLLAQPDRIGSVAIHPGAIDLGLLHRMVNAWFAGLPVYTGPHAHLNTSPPASMALIAPVYGWREPAAVMLAWTVAAVAAVAWLVPQLVRESGAETRLERAFVALMPLAIYPTGAVIGNGQLTLFVLPLALAGVLLLRSREGGWGRDIVASLLIVASLAKPAVTAPFFLVAAFAVRGCRPALLVVAAYAALTLFAATFQPMGAVAQLRQFLALAAVMSVSAGEANLHILLADLGLAGWIAPASLAVVALLAVWVWRHRRIDVWLLIGVVAIAARFWTYHRWYDDLLILLPMLALFRIAKQGPASDDLDLAAGTLLGLTLAFLLAPGGLYLLPAPWNRIYVDVQVVVWISDLVFLIVVAARARAKESVAA